MSDFALIIFFATFFCWWLLNLIFERFLNLSPIILPKKVVQEKDEMISKQQNKELFIHMRSSKSLDAEGNFRIQTKPALHYVKCVVSLLLTIIGLSPFFSDFPLIDYKRLFVDLDPTAIKLPFVQAAAATLLSWYFFETIMLSQYYKIQWSVIIHHWLTSIAALLVLLGFFTPAAIMYGIFMVALPFPVSFIMGFRTQFGDRFPKEINKAHSIISIYYKILLAMCISFELLLLWNGVNKEVHSMVYICAIIFCCIVWCYDDLKLAKSLKEASVRNYEDLDFIKLKEEYNNELKKKNN